MRKLSENVEMIPTLFMLVVSNYFFIQTNSY